MAVIGAILGDIAGSQFEFNRPENLDYKHCELFTNRCSYTDDMIMTLAVKKAILADADFTKTMREVGQPYPYSGYGGRFYEWMYGENPKPYNSFGNGSAMRVSFVGEHFDALEDVISMAEKSAEVTHNHPEGIKGAQATAACIYLARTGKSKQKIKEYIETIFGYNLSRTCDEIRPTYYFNESCQGTVPESIIAFLESTDYESAIRLTISLGGDADTMGAITGGIAEAYYKEIPQYIREEVLKRLPNEFIDIMQRFYEMFVDKRIIKNSI